MKKFKLLSIILSCLSLLQANSEDGLRGSIVTQDGQVLSKSSAEGGRIFSFRKSFSPVLGYVTFKEEGKRGVEEVADTTLSLGYDVHLTINLRLQQKIEAILDQAKINSNADHVIVAVMESKTGKIVAMASSNRYDPRYIREEDIPSLALKFTKYPYEPGTVISPFVLAIALEHNLLTTDTVFNIYNGKMEYAEEKSINDVQKFDVLSAANIIIDFSHIGMMQISWLLSGSEFREGLQNFGFGEPSGIEFSCDLAGTLQPLNEFEKRLPKAVYSLGYGMLTTFTQLLKAYNVFNNDGISVNPSIISHIIEGREMNYFKKAEGKRVMSLKTSEQIHNILVANHVQETKLNTKYPNLELGGKKSTAKIFKKGKYSEEYHSGFYGFANDDEGHKYTIGVLVIRPKDVKGRAGSQSAFSVFEDVSSVLMECNALKMSI